MYNINNTDIICSISVSISEQKRRKPKANKGPRRERFVGMYDNAAEFITDLFPLVTILSYADRVFLIIAITGIVSYFELGWRIVRRAEPIIRER